MDAGQELEGRLLAGRYRLESAIASGGMGGLWLAGDEVLGRPVAVKVLHDHLASDEALLERFRMEAIAAARLSHPAVVRVFDTGIDDGVCFIVMELVEGRTLRDMLTERGALPPAEAVGIVVGVLQALAHAHREQVIHRDIKPGNILLGRDGAVKLADFGIAKAAFTDDLTTTGNLLGTSRYLSPEQVTGGDVDGRSDLYSVGVVLYEALTGRPPFEADTHIATATQRLTSDPAPPRSIRPGISRQLEAVVMTALGRDPAERFQTAEEMRAALERVAPSESRPRPAQPVHDVPARRSVRSWVLVPVVLLLLAGIAVGGFLLLEGFGEETPDRGGPAPRGSARIGVEDAVAYDPIANDGEHDEDAFRAVDGNEETYWTTEGYDQNLDVIDKDGVGLALELEDSVSVGGVRMYTDTPGWEFSLYATDDLSTFDYESSTPAATSTALGEGRYRFETPTEARYLVIWITRLVLHDGYRAHINEVHVLAPDG